MPKVSLNSMQQLKRSCTHKLNCSFLYSKDGQNSKFKKVEIPRKIMEPEYPWNMHFHKVFFQIPCSGFKRVLFTHPYTNMIRLGHLFYFFLYKGGGVDIAIMITLFICSSRFLIILPLPPPFCFRRHLTFLWPDLRRSRFFFFR